MILGKYIKQFLNDRKQVVLPGFGNLEVKESGGGIPPSGGRINPPGLTVRFDPLSSKDNGLLAKALASGEGMDVEEAGQQVLEFVDDLKFALDKGEPFTIPGTGTLTRDSDGKVHFKTDPAWVLEPDQYGLEPMDLDLLILDESYEEETAPAEKLPGTPPKEVPAPHTEAKVTPRPVIRTSGHAAQPPPARKTTRPGKRWRVIWIVAGSLIIILLALIFIPQNPLRKSGPKAPADTQDTQVQPGGGIEAESPAQGADPSLEEPPSLENMEREEIPAREEPQPARQNHKYILVAGSFSHLKNASDLQDELKGRGYPAEVMITENRMYRVSVASYATKAEAERALEAMKSEPGLGSCWLLSN